LTQATGQFQRTAGQLTACVGVAEQARTAIDQMRTSVAKATETAQRAVETVRQDFRLECVRAVCLLCVFAWLFGVLTGVVFQRWRSGGTQTVPPAIGVPIAAPSSTEPTPKRSAPAPVRDRHREPHTPPAHGKDAKPAHGTDVERASNSRGTATRADHAKPKA
jgi:hypothetical protein